MNAPLLSRGDLAAIKTRSILRIGARHHTTQRREPANLTGILWLTHCCDCDLWLQPHESCLHIPALPSVAQGSREGVCPSPSALPADDSASSAGEVV